MLERGEVNINIHTRVIHSLNLVKLSFRNTKSLIWLKYDGWAGGVGGGSSSSSSSQAFDGSEYLERMDEAMDTSSHSRSRSTAAALRSRKKAGRSLTISSGASHYIL